MATPSTSSNANAAAQDERPVCAPAQPQPNPERVRRRLERILDLMRAERKMVWDFAEQLLYQRIFPDMTYCLPDEEGARYRADFEREWRRLETA